jgi:hypothetical protein
LTLHVTRLWERGIDFAACQPVAAETMENACVISEWFTSEAIRIYACLAGEVDGGGLSFDAKTIMKVLRKTGVPMTANEIRFANRQTQKIGNIETELRGLVDAELIQSEFRKNPKGGAGTLWYRISDTDTVSVS